ncbi:MAG TPA: hypothetical protein VFZ91_11170 [Allosphingosinicella sp.]
MPPASPFRLTWLLPVAVAGLACIATADESATARVPSGRCGIAAAMDHRQPEALRDNPPACALPTAREVESSCAAYDLVTSPGYRPPSVDDEGNATGGTDMREYGVSNLRCRFTGRHHNRALCRFRLSLPEGRAIGAAVTFKHVFVQDHGPAHHLYGTQWMPAGRCAPASASARPTS